tara:strand:- start:399 stop:632 length:234 start_codon:yes stop_codon:yes gene_type:complete
VEVVLVQHLVLQLIGEDKVQLQLFQLFLLLEAEEVVLKIHLFNSVVRVVQVEVVVNLILVTLIIQVVVVKELATHLQ